MGMGIQGSVARAALTRCGCDGAAGMLLYRVGTRQDFNRGALCLGDLPASIVRHEEIPVTPTFGLFFSVITVRDQPRNISHGRYGRWIKKCFVGASVMYTCDSGYAVVGEPLVCHKAGDGVSAPQSHPTLHCAGVRLEPPGACATRKGQK